MLQWHSFELPNSRLDLSELIWKFYRQLYWFVISHQITWRFHSLFGLTLNINYVPINHLFIADTVAMYRVPISLSCTIGKRKMSPASLYIFKIKESGLLCYILLKYLYTWIRAQLSVDIYWSCSSFNIIGIKYWYYLLFGSALGVQNPWIP